MSFRFVRLNDYSLRLTIVLSGCIACAMILCMPELVSGQAPDPAGSQTYQPGVARPGAPGPPVSIDLATALRRARDYGQQFLTSAIAAQLAHEDHVQPKAALFPTVNFLNQYIYTQGNGTPSG